MDETDGEKIREGKICQTTEMETEMEMERDRDRWGEETEKSVTKSEPLANLH